MSLTREKKEFGADSARKQSLSFVKVSCELKVLLFNVSLLVFSSSRVDRQIRSG